MLTLLRELYRHQAWADAEHWKALEFHLSALDDETIRKRLYHIHVAQHAFILIAQKKRPIVKRPEDFTDMKLLKEYAIANHQLAANFLEACTEAQLEEIVRIPWLKDPPLSLSLGEALLQATMHSHYHRGQNAARLRELGGEPPMTDFIGWIWKGKSNPDWNK
jgi:uncharacterized damage-inducible protein DinB